MDAPAQVAGPKQVQGRLISSLLCALVAVPVCGHVTGLEPISGTIFTIAVVQAFRAAGLAGRVKGPPALVHVTTLWAVVISSGWVVSCSLATSLAGPWWPGAARDYTVGRRMLAVQRWTEAYGRGHQGRLPAPAAWHGLPTSERKRWRMTDAQAFGNPWGGALGSAVPDAMLAMPDVIGRWPTQAEAEAHPDTLGLKPDPRYAGAFNYVRVVGGGWLAIQKLGSDRVVASKLGFIGHFDGEGAPWYRVVALHAQPSLEPSDNR